MKCKCGAELKEIDGVVTCDVCFNKKVEVKTPKTKKSKK